MKTVLHYTDTVGFGGAEKMMIELASALAARGWRSILAYHPVAGNVEIGEEGARRGLNVQELPPIDPRRRVRSVPTLARAFRLHRPVVFHAHLPWPLRSSVGIVAATLARIPARLATQQLFSEASARRRLRRQKLISATVDEYIAVSNAMARRIRPMVMARHGVPVVHNAVAHERFAPAAGGGTPRRERGSARPVILSLARLDEQKGIQHLLAAAVLVPEADFALAGDGPDRDRLEADARRLGVAERFRFLGYRVDVPEILAGCDLFVLSSLYEGLPISVLEAMAAGKPVVATAIEGTDEAVLDGVTGLLVPPGDPAAMAAAIRRILADPALAARMGDAGRERVLERFSIDAMVQAVEALYREVLHRKGHALDPKGA